MYLYFVLVFLKCAEWKKLSGVCGHRQRQGQKLVSFFFFRIYHAAVSGGGGEFVKYKVSMWPGQDMFICYICFMWKINIFIKIFIIPIWDMVLGPSRCGPYVSMPMPRNVQMSSLCKFLPIKWGHEHASLIIFNLGMPTSGRRRT